MTSDPVRHGNTIIFPASLDPKAITVVRRLTEAGFESYLVGGCVRDLLLGRIPKDFDASTEARPRQIRRVFRNCRIIGRRFKLAHVHFGDNIIEVATFRRNPSETDSDDEPGQEDGDEPEAVDNDDLLITRDNVYGSAEEDIRRRDFTMNALLYDVATDEVIDYVGGFEDLENKTLRTIGDAQVRLAEDPVRMLRAVKFTSRLGLTLDADLDAAMHASAELISRSAPPRVLEEIYKLLTCGGAEKSLDMLIEYGLLEQLLPEISEHWMGHREPLCAVGRAIDIMDGGQRKLGNAFLLAALIHDPWRALLDADENVDPLATVRDMLQPAALRMNIPRRDVAIAKQLLMTQLRLERPRRTRRFRMSDFLNRPITVDAIDLLYLRTLAGTADPEQHAEWAQRLAELHGPPEENRRVGQGPKTTGRRRRRRRSRGSGGSDSRRDSQDDSMADSPGESLAAEAPGAADDGSAESPAARRTTRPPREGKATDRPAARRRRSSKSASAAPSAGEPRAAPSPARAEHPPRSQPAAGSSTESTDAAGLGGKVRSWFRRILGAPGSVTSPTPADIEPTSAQTGRESQAGTAGSTTEAAAPTPDAGGDAESASRPRRRRRRRRGPRTNDGAANSGSESSEPSTAANDGPAAEGADQGKGEGSGDKTDDKPATSRRRRSRSGRGRGGSRGAENSSSRSSKKAGGSESKTVPRPKRRSSSGRDGDSKRSRRSEQPSSTTNSSPPTPQNRPEDIEDVFDW